MAKAKLESVFQQHPPRLSPEPWLTQWFLCRLGRESRKPAEPILKRHEILRLVNTLDSRVQIPNNAREPEIGTEFLRKEFNKDG